MTGPYAAARLQRPDRHAGVRRVEEVTVLRRVASASQQEPDGKMARCVSVRSSELSSQLFCSLEGVLVAALSQCHLLMRTAQPGPLPNSRRGLPRKMWPWW